MALVPARLISCSASAATSAIGPCASHTTGSAQTVRISSRSSGDTAITVVAEGPDTAASARRNSARIRTAPAMRTACIVSAGTHSPVSGGTMNSARSVVIRITPAVANSSCARGCRCVPVSCPGA